MNSYKNIKLNEEIQIKKDQGIMHESGSLKVWVQKKEDYIELYADNQLPKNTKSPPKDAVWQRWIISGDTVSLKCMPHVPDQPVQTVFSSPLIVPAGKSVQLFYGLPVWVNVILTNPQNLSLGQFPSQPLTNTWIGNFFEGELIYEDFQEVHFKPEPNTDPFIFICPVEVKNSGSKFLMLYKLLIRVNNLPVYTDNKNFWLGKITFIFANESELTDVRIANSLPKSLGEFTLVDKAVSQDRKSTLTKMFSPIRMKNTLILSNK